MILGCAETKIKRNVIFFFSQERLLHKQNMSLPSIAQAPGICHFTDVPSITHPNSTAPLQPTRAKSPHWWTRHSVWGKTWLPRRQNSNYNLLESNFFFPPKWFLLHTSQCILMNLQYESPEWLNTGSTENKSWSQSITLIHVPSTFVISWNLSIVTSGVHGTIPLIYKKIILLFKS